MLSTIIIFHEDIFEIKRVNILSGDDLKIIDSVILVLLSNSLVTNNDLFWLFGDESGEVNYEK